MEVPTRRLGHRIPRQTHRELCEQVNLKPCRKIIDLGCGEGFLQEELVKHGFNPKKIGSYDLVSLKPFIKEADIANLPIKDGVADLCVFCLSLMGTNYLNFIR
jgi:ribosomal RNA-processing protein 8